jgi:hypothetical protein
MSDENYYTPYSPNILSKLPSFIPFATEATFRALHSRITHDLAFFLSYAGISLVNRALYNSRHHKSSISKGSHLCKGPLEDLKWSGGRE